MELTCECGEKATNFHSKCCGVHMEGVITEEGDLQVVYEYCGKYVGTIVDRKNLERITVYIEHIVSEWDDRHLFGDFDGIEPIYQKLCKIIGKDSEDFNELYKVKSCD